MENQTINEKICMITGASDGIGKATAFAMARLNYTVMLVCRNQEKGLKVLHELTSTSGNQKHELYLADLSFQTDIQKMVIDYKKKHNTLQILINNAAVAPQKHRTLTNKGLEINFAVNHLGHFYLTNLLLDILKNSTPSRIITLASSAEKFTDFDIHDLQLEKKYSAFRAYAVSKHENILFTYELARHLQATGVQTICVNPGGVKTKVSSQMPGFYGVMAKLYQPFALTPEKASEAIVYLATSPEVAQYNGQYFEKKKPVKSSKESYNIETARSLWDISLQLTGLSESADVSSF